MIALAGLLAAAVVAQAAPVAKVPALPAPRILVVPFETPGRDARTYWLGEGVAVLIAENIDARGLGAMTRAARERAYGELHLPANAVLTHATVIKVGQLVNAAQVVIGDVSVDGDMLAIRARAIRLDVGRENPEVVERGSLSDLFAVAQRAAERVVPGGGPAAVEHPPVQAFEQYVKGLLAEEPATQASFLEAALQIDQHYDRARLALWDVRTGQGQPAAALAAVRGIGDESPFSRRARFLAGVSLLALKQYDDAFADFTALLDTSPEQAAVLNNVGVLQIRRGATPDTGKATYYLTRAAHAEPDDPDILFNLGYAYALDRDPQAAMYWLREALRRDPADGDAHYVLAAELEASGSSVEAARERQLAVQLSEKYADRRGDGLPKGLERVRQDMDPRQPSAVEQVATTAQRDQQDLAQFHLDRARRLYAQERDREAITELRRTVFLSPYEAEAHLLLGRIYLRSGRPREAVDALKISIWSRDSAAAHAVLADAYLRLKDTAHARAELQKALALDPGSEDAKQVQQKLERGGR